jgi:very-short-patch-repair endonuclease
MASLIKAARRLRRDQTDAERKLWFELRDRRLGGLKFRRQLPLGSYVVDFCCESAHLIVELDGRQHNENPADEIRTRALEWATLCSASGTPTYWRIDGVLETIRTIAKQPTSNPSPQPSPYGRGGAFELVANVSV